MRKYLKHNKIIISLALLCSFSLIVNPSICENIIFIVFSRRRLQSETMQKLVLTDFEGNVWNNRLNNINVLRYFLCSLAAGVISGMLAGLTEAECVSVGLAAAHDSLHSFTAVPQQFSTQPRPAQFSLVESTLKRSLL